MKLTKHHEDIITEAVNIGIGRAASSLSEIVGASVSLKVPSIRFCSLADVREHISSETTGSATSITQPFEGAISGSAEIVLSEEGAVTLAQLLHGDAPTDAPLDILQQGILVEVGNIILNGVLGSLSNLIEANLTYGVPEFQDNAYSELNDGAVGSEPGRSQDVLLADARFDVHERSIDGSLLILFDVGSVENLVEKLEALTV